MPSAPEHIKFALEITLGNDDIMNSPIKFGFDAGGAFWCVCLDRRLAVYNYATSPNADKAAKHSDDEAYLLKMATEMLKKENALRIGLGDTKGFFENLFIRVLKIAHNAILRSERI